MYLFSNNDKLQKPIKKGFFDVCFRKSTSKQRLHLIFGGGWRDFIHKFGYACVRVFYCKVFNPRSLLEKIVTRSLDGEGGQSDPPPPSTFDTVHPNDLKFGTYNKLHLYFQLSETTWCLIGFHGNNSQIYDVTGGRHLGFSNFQILFKFSLLYLRLTGKQHSAVEIHEIGRIHCEVVSI